MLKSASLSIYLAYRPKNRHQIQNILRYAYVATIMQMHQKISSTVIFNRQAYTSRRHLSRTVGKSTSVRLPQALPTWSVGQLYGIKLRWFIIELYLHGSVCFYFRLPRVTVFLNVKSLRGGSCVQRNRWTALFYVNLTARPKNGTFFICP